MGYNAPMKFYTLLEQALSSEDIEDKESICDRLLAYCNENNTKIDYKDELDDKFAPKTFATPSYASFCQIVSPRDLPRRKHFDTNEGLAILVHAIAHIEFSAIDLALDAVYRFSQMPREYDVDWLLVARDEIRHFKILNAILEELGYKYGDFPVHQGLFDASVHARDDVLERMAVIPRHYEATGLDVNPQIIQKLQPYAKKKIVSNIIESLQMIEREEIAHVSKGDKWFRRECQQRGLEPEETFRKILDKYTLLRKRPHMNISARKAAGFSCDELLKLGAKQCVDD